MHRSLRGNALELREHPFPHATVELLHPDGAFDVAQYHVFVGLGSWACISSLVDAVRFARLDLQAAGHGFLVSILLTL